MRSVLPLVAPAILVACASVADESTPGRPPMEDGLHVARMIVLDRPPIIAAQRPEELVLAARAAEGADPAELIARPSSRWVRVDALPYLTQTEAGRRFLAAAMPRALARGMPAEFCPAAETAAAPGAGRAEAARAALQGCLAGLGPGHEECGCRVVALDQVVTVPREEMVYATGVSARMRVPGLGLDLMLVAEDAAAGETVLRDLVGPVARIEHGPGDAVTVVFARSDRRFEGFRIPVGFRRGRLAERIYALDGEGTRLSLLIGFEPDELAGHAAAWLAWPKQG